MQFIFLDIQEACARQDQSSTKMAQRTHGQQQPAVKMQCVHALMNITCNIIG